MREDRRAEILVRAIRNWDRSSAALMDLNRRMKQDGGLSDRQLVIGLGEILSSLVASTGAVVLFLTEAEAEAVEAAEAGSEADAP